MCLVCLILQKRVILSNNTHIGVYLNNDTTYNNIYFEHIFNKNMFLVLYILCAS